MSYTPSELIAALDRHDVYVTERRLTDWRAKGLLPPLKRIGLGRGKGTRQVWESDEVLQQAIAVEFFLYLKSRTRYALARLWLAGFDVPVEKGKGAWLENIKRKTEYIDRKANKDPGGLAGYLSFFQERAIKKISKKDGSQTITDLFNELVTDYLELIFDKDFKFDDGYRAKTIREAFKLQLDRKGRVNLRWAARFFYTGIKSFSVDSLAHTIATTGNLELEKANFAMRVLKNAIVRGLTLIGPEFELTYCVETSARIVSDIAPALILGHINFQKGNAESLLDNSIEIIANSLKLLSITDIIRSHNSRFSLSKHGKFILEQAKAELKKLWSDFGRDADQWNTDSAKPLNLN